MKDVREEIEVVQSVRHVQPKYNKVLAQTTKKSDQALNIKR